MSGLSMTSWLLDTAMWTALLIALVLLIRRPVTKHFGPKVAYALWAIPAIRLVLPPVMLPASFAPVEVAPPSASDVPLSATALAAEPISQAASTAADPAISIAPMSLLQQVLSNAWLGETILVIWLVGAGAFLFLRFFGYFRMRDELLSDAKEMGHVGKVRLVETPAASAPLAFGIFDKVVALPTDFLALTDSEMRDLALAHELAHHRGGDLLINMLMQPLFALHWFNPLGHYGWLALRRDQEAACDARVIEARPLEKRATYARTIASFATGPNVALAAPMACPVLGEKSIIERLRSLKMSNTSPRRTKAGKALLIAGLIALPLTASVTYAEAQSVEEAFADEAVTAPDVSAPPVPPEAPDAPLPPEPPVPPEAPPAPEVDEKTYVYKFKSAHAGDDKVRQVKKMRIKRDGEPLTAEEREQIHLEIREAMAESAEARREAHEAMKEVRIELRETMHQLREGEHERIMELAESGKGHTVVEMTCEGENASSTKTLEDGTNVVMICESKIMAHALKGLEEARKAIASNPEMDDEMKSEVLRSLDAEIQRWQEEKSAA